MGWLCCLGFFDDLLVFLSLFVLMILIGYGAQRDFAWSVVREKSCLLVLAFC